MSLQNAERKWTENTANAGTQWKSGVSRAESDGAYCKGINQVLGGNAPGCPRRANNWAQGVNSISASDFQQSVQGKGSKWAENYRRAFA